MLRLTWVITSHGIGRMWELKHAIFSHIVEIPENVSCRYASEIYGLYFASRMVTYFYAYCDDMIQEVFKLIVD